MSFWKSQQPHILHPPSPCHINMSTYCFHFTHHFFLLNCLSNILFTSFPLKIGTTTFSAHSTGILSPSRTIWHLSTIALMPISSFYLFNACTTSYTVYWTFCCISLHIMIPIVFFVYNPFYIILFDFTSSH